jgi:hypothetical protein
MHAKAFVFKHCPLAAEAFHRPQGFEVTKVASPPESLLEDSNKQMKELFVTFISIVILHCFMDADGSKSFGNANPFSPCGMIIDNLTRRSPVKVLMFGEKGRFHQQRSSPSWIWPIPVRRCRVSRVKSAKPTTAPRKMEINTCPKISMLEGAEC